MSSKALCDICAVGHESYVIDEAEETLARRNRPNWTEKYGNCAGSLIITGGEVDIDVCYLSRSAAGELLAGNELFRP